MIKPELESRNGYKKTKQDIQIAEQELFKQKRIITKNQNEYM